MKRMIVFLCALAMALGTAMPASAALVTITFDEPGISAGGGPDPLNPVQGCGDLITNQYAAWGVNWIVDPASTQPHNEVTLGEWFKNAFDIGSDNQILWYNGSTIGGNIQLDVLADSVSFRYRKPSDTDPIQVKLYNGSTEVYDSGVFDAIGSWQIFSYIALDSSDYFDRIWMYSPDPYNKKFVIDDLQVNMVPIPSALLLLGSGLIPVVIRRAR